MFALICLCLELHRPVCRTLRVENVLSKQREIQFFTSNLFDFQNHIAKCTWWQLTQYQGQNDPEKYQWDIFFANNKNILTTKRRDNIVVADMAADKKNWQEEDLLKKGTQFGKKKKTSQELQMLSSVTINCQVQRLSLIQVLNCQYCNQCRKCHKFLWLLH